MIPRKLPAGKAAMVGAVSIPLLLLACSSEVDQLKRQLETMKKGGASLDELCRQELKIADAYSRTGDVRKYQEARAVADIQCVSAELERGRLSR